ncbi:MAG: phosphate ABC transporter substrate-binding protein PstS [Marinilabiliales bacterium]
MKKLILKTVLLLLTASILVSCKNSAKQNENKISISGAFALYPITVKWAEEYKKLHPEVIIDISAGGAGKGITDVLSGMVDLAMFSREVSQDEIEKGAWKIALVKDAVLPTYNTNNPYKDYINKRGFTREELKKIYVTGEIKSWDFILEKSNDAEAPAINVYTRSDACGAASMWGKFFGLDQEDLNGIGVFGDPGMADAVKNDIYGVGYNNVIYVFDPQTLLTYTGLEVIPIDFNENGLIDEKEKIYENIYDIMNAIKKDIYPSPPARDLYFISKGKPQKQCVRDFIVWILTDGQKYVKEAGYVQLTTEKINNEINKLK